MSWDEFSDLLSGLNENTPLAGVVKIRTETDREVLKDYTPGMRKIRNEWLTKRAKQRPQSDTDAFINMMQNTFAKIAKKE